MYSRVYNIMCDLDEDKVSSPRDYSKAELARLVAEQALDDLNHPMKRGAKKLRDIIAASENQKLFESVEDLFWFQC